MIFEPPRHPTHCFNFWTPHPPGQRLPGAVNIRASWRSIGGAGGPATPRTRTIAHTPSEGLCRLAIDGYVGDSMELHEQNNIYNAKHLNKNNTLTPSARLLTIFNLPGSSLPNLLQEGESIRPSWQLFHILRFWGSVRPVHPCLKPQNLRGLSCHRSSLAAAWAVPPLENYQDLGMCQAR